LGGRRLLDGNGNNSIGRAALDGEPELAAVDLISVDGRPRGLLDAVRLAEARSHVAAGGRLAFVEGDIHERALGRALHARGAAFDFGDGAIRVSAAAKNAEVAVRARRVEAELDAGRFADALDLDGGHLRQQDRSFDGFVGFHAGPRIAAPEQEVHDNGLPGNGRREYRTGRPASQPL
jgi:hypothetical protein